MLRSLLLLLVLLCTPACSADVDAVGQTSSDLVVGNRLSSNRLSSNRLAQNRLAQNRLAQNRLAQNRLAQNRLAQNRLAQNHIELDATAVGDLLATEDGREVLGFVIGCAIPARKTLVATHDGTTYEFPGALGLAPHWLKRPLDRKGQRWVSACLFARVNAAGLTVEVSLRGPNRALRTSADEMARWSLEEGAFWGNWFTPSDEPIDWNACRGIDQANGETGDLADRDCTEPDPSNPGFTLCGFKYAGDCGDSATASEPPACRGYDAEGMYYTRCSAPRERTRYREVITAFAKR